MGMLEDLTALGKQAAVGVATIPSEVMRFGAYVANPMRVYRKVTGQSTEVDDSRYGEGYAPYNRIPQVLEGAADAYNNVVSNAVGVNPNPSPQDDTAEYVARLAGNTIPTLPGKVLTAAATHAPSLLARLAGTTTGKVVGKTAELLTPTTIVPAAAVAGKSGAEVVKAVAPRWAANVGVQGAAGVALERGLEPRDPTKPYIQYDADGKLTSAYYPDESALPGAGRVVADTVVNAVGEHPIAAGITAAGLAGLGLLAHRGIRKTNAIRAETATSDAVGAPVPKAPDVPITTNPIASAAYRTAEVLADEHIRTRKALDMAAADTNAKANAAAQAAGTPAPPQVTAQAAKDAINLAGDSAHASRLESIVNDGIMVTPRGEVKTTSLRELGRGIYAAATKAKDFAKAFNEYIAYADEINNRAYGAAAIARGKPGAKLVNIDRLTGEEAGPTTIPTNIVREPPRVNMWHLDTPTLTSRRTAIEQGPHGAQVQALAKQYWKFHNDIADAAVSFGVVSKAERDLWGRANPEFRHTINLDNPKSPRTYRGRGHAAGAKVEGDALLSAGEYADYMLNQMHVNRAKSQSFDILRDSRWIGKIADPAQLRRETVIDATTGLPRTKTKDDVTLNPANKRSFYRDGEIVDFEVLNPQLRHTMDKHPALAQTLFGTLRGWAQSGMTGKFSLAVGQPFGVANAEMGQIMGVISRPAGRSISALDSGKKGIVAGVTRTLDPTNLTRSIGAAAGDIRAIMNRAIADALYNSIEVGGGFAKGIGWISPGGAKQFADRAAQMYLNSSHAERSARGGGNASTMGERDFDTPHGKMTLLESTSPQYNRIRVISDPKDIKGMWQEFNRTVTPTNFKVGVRLLNDIQEAIGNMAQSNLYRNNRQKGQALDTAAKVPEAARDASLALAAPHLTLAKQFMDQGRAHRAARNFVAARAQYAQAKALRTQAEPHLLDARRHDADAAKAREEWFREISNLSLAARELLGDSGAKGTGLALRGSKDATIVERAVGATLNSTPYGNIGMQAGARLIRAMVEDPTGTAASMATMIGTVTTLSMGSAMLYDKIMGTGGTDQSAVKHDLERPDWHKVRHVPVYIPGVPLDSTPHIRLDPQMQFLHAISRVGAEQLAGWTGGADDPIKGHTREQIMQIASDRAHSILATGFINSLPITQLPPPVGAVLAYAGADVPTPESIVNRGGLSLTPQRGLGGLEDTRNANDIIGKRASNALGQLFGTAGATVVETTRQGYQGQLGTMGFASRALDTLKGRAEDRLPELQPLWPHPARRATNNFFADAVNAKEGAIDNLRQNKSAIVREGAIGTGRGQTLDREGGGIQGAPDNIKASLVRAVVFGDSMKVLRQARESTRQRLLSIDQQNLDYAARRNKQNELAKEVTRLNTELLAHYTQFEDQESRRIGRRFRLDHLDPTKGIEQFPMR
jgi:hypothetical protein